MEEVERGRGLRVDLSCRWGVSLFTGRWPGAEAQLHGAYTWRSPDATPATRGDIACSASGVCFRSSTAR